MPLKQKRPASFRTKWLALLAVLLGSIWAFSGLLGWQAALRYRFEVGDRLVYRFEFKGAGNADLRPLLEETNATTQQAEAFGGLVQHFSTSVRGDLVLTVVERDGEGFTVAYSLRNAAVESDLDARRSPEQSEVLRRDLERAVFAAVDQRGGIKTVQFETGVDPASQALLRLLLGAIQVVLPQNPQEMSTSWEVQEGDSSGSYIARYELKPADTKRGAPCQVIRKRKLRYLQLASSDRDPGRKRFLKGDDNRVSPTVQPDVDLVACFDTTSGRLVSLRGSEKQVISLQNRTIGDSETLVNLEFLRTEHVGATALTSLKQIEATRTTTAAPLSVEPSAEDAKTMARRGTLGDATFESLLAELAQREASGQKENTGLYLKFRALAYLRPETCPALGRLVASAEVNSLTFRTLSDALGEAASPEAQAALVAATRERKEDRQALLKLIPLLGLSNEPTVLAERALQDFAFGSADSNTTSTAQLALGNMAHRLADKFPDRAHKIVNSLVERMPAKSDEEISELLLVIGNAGLVDLMPQIVRFVSHPSAEIRATAVAALRFVESEQADELLTRALADDSSSTVRKSAGYALSFRKLSPATFAAQKRSLLKDESEDVRLAVLDNLWSEREAFAEIPELFKRVASEDPSKNVRERASSLLRSAP